ncbi:MAG TPA: MerR family transcriptional regulator [Tepidisphaeraceae bacterium]|nr:MerR family transcriptional regulator [Tepidisphaeraceae bacterium]
MSIGELADAAGLTRRAVRFYVQQKLLPTPLGVGRGSHYDGTHLAQLRRVLELQRAGHSLEEIRHVLAGGGVERRVEAVKKEKRPPAKLRAALWRRLEVLDGVELSFDAAKFDPTVEELLELREAIVRVFRPDLAE